jgi:beta-glucosidase
LYLSAPSKNTDKPSSELKAAKTNVLNPGEKSNDHHDFKAKRFGLVTTKKCLIVEAGLYKKAITSSLNTNKVTFTLGKETVVEKTNSSLLLMKNLRTKT